MMFREILKVLVGRFGELWARSGELFSFVCTLCAWLSVLGLVVPASYKTDKHKTDIDVPI